MKKILEYIEYTKYMMTTLHSRTQEEIVNVCKSIGLHTQKEYICNGYRSDVFAFDESNKYAFEVQITPQTLKKTEERQNKYLKDNITACWLFEKEPNGYKEMEHLPIFKLSEQNNKLSVSLKNRETLSLENFVKDFIDGKIKFCNTMKMLPQVQVVFIEFPCWKCKEMNHIFYIAPFHSSCKAELRIEESMWSSNKFRFKPEILEKIIEYSRSEKGNHLKLATVKERYSKSVEGSYMSFGCHKCDSIFGDFFVEDVIMDYWYEDITKMDTTTFDIEIDLHLNIPHWCHSKNKDFCE